MKTTGGTRWRGALGYNSPFMRLLENITNLLLLNFWMLLTSLPVVTLGAAMMAGDRTATRIRGGQNALVTRDYFAAFREALKQGVAWTGLVALAIALFWLDFRYLGRVAITLRLAAFNLLAIMAVVAVLVACLLVTYLSHYDESLRHAARNCVIILTHHVGWVALLALTTLLPLILLEAGPVGWWTLLYWFSFLGLGVAAWGRSVIFAQLVRRFAPAATNKGETHDR
ncbi:DUF624 domain-containing protein [Lacticaseibacillus kribbianus]|uniref:DUF624 domain-containing protein n=1 Tax=Lacticaseibacillus kribbianus TaxID=2926292 RepID=UPI001CD679B1|nr:DUF624 domain-containing protein [Lacticaseibacillus kribbianus]